MDYGVKLSCMALLVSILLLLGVRFFHGQDLKQEAVSPDEKHVATVFIRNCGATTGYVTHVAVHGRSSDQTDDDLVFTVENEHIVRVEWIDNLRLRISCENCEEKQAFRRVTKLGDVSIEYSGV